MSDKRTPAQVAWANDWHRRISGSEGSRRRDFMAGFDAAVGLRVQTETNDQLNELLDYAENEADIRNDPLVIDLCKAVANLMAAVGVQTEPDTTRDRAAEVSYIQPLREGGNWSTVPEVVKDNWRTRADEVSAIVNGRIRVKQATTMGNLRRTIDELLDAGVPAESIIRSVANSGSRIGHREALKEMEL